MLNSPCNPTGAVYTEQELRALAAVLERHPSLWIISDDMYEHMLFDGRPLRDACRGGAAARRAHADRERGARRPTP